MQEKKTPVSSDLFYRRPGDVDRETYTEHIPRIKNKAYTTKFKKSFWVLFKDFSQSKQWIIYLFFTLP